LVNVYKNPETVLPALADFIVTQAHESIARRGKFNLVLSGGSSPKKLYQLLASEAYRDAYGLPKSLADLRNHRIVKQHGVQLDETGYARILGLESLEGIVGISTNSSVAVLYAIERGAGVGFLPTSAIALGAPLVAIDLGINYHMDLWLTYHKEFRNSDRHKIVIEWLKSIFDPKVHGCFRDEFIHPNDLTPLMVSSRQNFGLQGYAAPKPF